MYLYWNYCPTYLLIIPTVDTLTHLTFVLPSPSRMHHPRLHSRALLLGVVLNLLALAVHCKSSQPDPMLAEESSPAYSTGVRYSNEAPMFFPKNYFQLVKRSASSPLLSQMSHPQGASSMSFLTKSVPTTNLDSSESGEVYKKSASEYWGNEVAAGGHGDSLEDQSSYGGGGHGGYGLSQQSHGGYMPSYGGMGYTKGKEIAIKPDHKPITLHYRTHAQPIMVHQTRIPGTSKYAFICVH